MRSAELDEKKYMFLPAQDINLRPKGREKKAEDIHIYEIDKDNEICGSCCGSFNLDGYYKVTAGGRKAAAAREYAAGKGREVCGRCVASLYSNTDD